MSVKSAKQCSKHNQSWNNIPECTLEINPSSATSVTKLSLARPTSSSTFGLIPGRSPTRARDVVDVSPMSPHFVATVGLTAERGRTHAAIVAASSPRPALSTTTRGRVDKRKLWQMNVIKLGASWPLNLSECVPHSDASVKFEGTKLLHNPDD